MLPVLLKEEEEEEEEGGDLPALPCTAPTSPTQTSALQPGPQSSDQDTGQLVLNIVSGFGFCYK